MRAISVAMIIVGLASSAVASAQGTASFGQREVAAIERLFDGYATAFLTRTMPRSEITFRLPSSGSARLIPPRGQTQISPLSADRAIVNKTYRRRRKDGTLVTEAASFYVVTRSSGSWKICGILNQNPREFGKIF